MEKGALLNAYLVTFLSALADRVIFVDAWRGESALLGPAARSLRRDIAELDQLRRSVVLLDSPGLSVAVVPAWRPAGLVSAIDEALLPHLRQGLLRLVDAIRAVFRLILIRVLSALSRYPDAITFVMRMLASSRCYGHRTEPGDYTSPISTSMPVVIGEAARLR